MRPSAQGYTPFFLRLYDVVVLWFSSSFAWRCPTDSVLLPFFKQHLGRTSHMDVGVGTGYFLARAAGLLRHTDVTLLDLNPNTLEMAGSRLAAAGHPKDHMRRVIHDVFNPLPEDLRGQYDAVSLFYLFHCLPGPMAVKAPLVFRNMSVALKPGGTIYGTTVLGKGVKHNFIGKALIRFYTKHKVFSHDEDDAEDLLEALKGQFVDAEVRVIGRIALFTAKQPRDKVELSSKQSQ